MSILAPSDFTGFYSLSFNTYSEDELQEFIDLNEDKYLCFLLGAELAQLLKDDLDLNGGTPTPGSRFERIWKAFCSDETGEIIFGYSGYGTFYDVNFINQSDGIKDYLKGLIYYDYIVEAQYIHTITGLVKNVNEVSNPVRNEDLFRYADKRWNRSVSTAEGIQWLVCYSEFEDEYPEYNGVRIPPKMYGIL